MYLRQKWFKPKHHPSKGWSKSGPKSFFRDFFVQNSYDILWPKYCHFLQTWPISWRKKYCSSAKNYKLEQFWNSNFDQKLKGFYRLGLLYKDWASHFSISKENIFSEKAILFKKENNIISVDTFLQFNFRILHCSIFSSQDWILWNRLL